MKKLKDFNADRRYKYSDKVRKQIIALKGKVSQTSVAWGFGVSRALVYKLWLPEATRKEMSVQYAKKTMRKYRTNKTFREKLLETKRNLWQYRRQVFTSYGEKYYEKHPKPLYKPKNTPKIKRTEKS